MSQGDLCLGCCVSRINIFVDDSKLCERCEEPVCLKCIVSPGCKHCELIYCDRCQGFLDLSTCYVCLCCHDNALICDKCKVDWCSKCKYATCQLCKERKCYCKN